MANVKTKAAAATPTTRNDRRRRTARRRHQRKTLNLAAKTSIRKPWRAPAERLLRLTRNRTKSLNPLRKSCTANRPVTRHNKCLLNDRSFLCSAPIGRKHNALTAVVCQSVRPSVRPSVSVAVPCLNLTRERKGVESCKSAGRKPVTRMTRDSVYRSKGQRSRSSGRLTPWPKIGHIFGTGRSTNFKLGIRMEYDHPHHWHARLPQRSKVFLCYFVSLTRVCHSLTKKSHRNNKLGRKIVRVAAACMCVCEFTLCFVFLLYFIALKTPFRLAASGLWCWSWEKEARAVEVVPYI